MYVCVADKAQPDTSPVTGIFNMPQSDPAIEGYIGEIADDDPRIATYMAGNE